MKVKYAVQVLSQSVANALKTMNQLGMPNFENIHATVEFLKLFDTLYDCMNSKHLKEQFQKAPLRKSNAQYWKDTFHKAVSYICNLKQINGKLLLHSKRYASFLGMNIHIYLFNTL